MNKFAWMTDCHLDHSDLTSFLHNLIKMDVNSFFITGDISTGNKICAHLEIISKILNNKKIYFVLGEPRLLRF